MGAPAATKAFIQRSIEAVLACDLPIYGVKIRRDGSVEIETVDRSSADPHPAPEKDQPEPWT